MVELLQNKMEAINCLLESSDKTFLNFKAVIDALNSRWDTIHISLLESSALSSNQLEISRGSSVSVYSNEEALEMSPEGSHAETANESSTEALYSPFFRSASVSGSGSVDESVTGRSDVIPDQIEDVIEEVVVADNITSVDFEVLESEDVHDGIDSKSDGGMQDRMEVPVRITPSADYDDDFEMYDVTRVDDGQYMKEFAERIEELDKLIENEEKGKRNHKIAGRKLDILSSTPKGETGAKRSKLDEVEDMCSSSMGSLISDSSGVFSFDHDEHNPAAVDMLINSLKNRMMLNRACVNQQEAAPMKEADGISDSPAFAKPCPHDGLMDEASQISSSATASTVVSLRSGYALMTKLPSNAALSLMSDSTTIQDDLSEGTVVFDPVCNDLHQMLNGDHNSQMLEYDSDACDSDVVIIRLEPIAVAPLICQEEVINDKPPSLKLKLSNEAGVSERSPMAELNPADVEDGEKLTKNSSGKVVVTLTSPDSDLFDFNELVRRLESSISGEEDNDDVTDDGWLEKKKSFDSRSSRSEGQLLPSIDITPPTPRKISMGSVASSAVASKTEETPLAESGSVNSKFVNGIIGPPTSLTRSISAPAPDIKVIPPTPRRMSLDIPLPFINVIPPTPRRQSLSSVCSNHRPARKESPPVLSTRSTPVLPRVWNWIESSQFTVNCDSPDGGSVDDGVPKITCDWQMELQDNSKTSRSSVDVIFSENEALKDDAISCERDTGSRNESRMDDAISIQSETVSQNKGAPDSGMADDFENEAVNAFVEERELVTNIQVEEVGPKSRGPICPSISVSDMSESVDNHDRDEDDEGSRKISITTFLESERSSLSVPASIVDDGEFYPRIAHAYASLSGKDREVIHENEVTVSDSASSDLATDAGQMRNQMLSNTDATASYSQNDKISTNASENVSENAPSVFEEIINSIDESMAEAPISSKDKLSASKNLSKSIDSLNSRDDLSSRDIANGVGMLEMTASSEVVAGKERSDTVTSRPRASEQKDKDTRENISDLIHSQMKDIDAHQLALRHRRDSGAIEECYFGAENLEDLIDSETHEAVAAGMDTFYTRIQNCLESMRNINEMSVRDDDIEDGGQHELAHQIHVSGGFLIFLS